VVTDKPAINKPNEHSQVTGHWVVAAAAVSVWEGGSVLCKHVTGEESGGLERKHSRPTETLSSVV